MLAIPNFSEGREPHIIEALGRAMLSVSGVRLLDVHTDPDHNRAVYTLAEAEAGPEAEAEPGGEPDADVDAGAGAGALDRRSPRLVDALLAGAAAALERLDIARHDGSHPYVGALDVAPLVYLDPAERGTACAQALVLADRLGTELHLPVFLYGPLTAGRVTRAELRRGGPQNLQRRIDAGELTPDFGPPRLHPRAGAVLVAARPPLVAFNVELAPPATLADARRIAGLIREGGAEGLASVRAIGLTLPHRGGVAQVSTNVEDYRRTSLAAVVEAIARHARPQGGEIVGLPPRAALDGFPDALPVRNRRSLEEALAATTENASGSRPRRP